MREWRSVKRERGESAECKKRVDGQTVDASSQSTVCIHMLASHELRSVAACDAAACTSPVGTSCMLSDMCRRYCVCTYVSFPLLVLVLMTSRADTCVQHVMHR